MIFITFLNIINLAIYGSNRLFTQYTFGYGVLNTYFTLQKVAGNAPKRF